MTTTEIKSKRQPREPKPYTNPYLAGAFLGLVLFASFFLTGNGLGASGGLNRILVFFEDLIAPNHVNTTPYLLEMAGGDKKPLESLVVFVTIGVLLGGFFSGWPACSQASAASARACAISP